MDETDRRRFAACLTAASELYGRSMSVALVDLYWRTLERFEMDAVERAFQQHMLSPDAGQYMPKPADIARMIGGTSLDAAQVAWAAVDRAVRLVGPYPSVTFDDPVTQRVVFDMGGWIKLGERTTAEWPFVANEFRARYEGFRSRGESPQHPPRLPGIAERDAISKGGSFDHVLLGDPARAKQVQVTGREGGDLAVRRAATQLRLVNSKEARE